MSYETGYKTSPLVFFLSCIFTFNYFQDGIFLCRLSWNLLCQLSSLVRKFELLPQLSEGNCRCEPPHLPLIFLQKPKVFSRVRKGMRMCYGHLCLRGIVLLFQLLSARSLIPIFCVAPMLRKTRDTICVSSLIVKHCLITAAIQIHLQVTVIWQRNHCKRIGLLFSEFSKLSGRGVTQICVRSEQWSCVGHRKEEWSFLRKSSKTQNPSKLF